jgi:hypothetical protein
MKFSKTDLFTVKRTRFTVILLLFVAIMSCNTKNNVYICTSPKAYAYHSNEDCELMNRCTYDVKNISLEKAIEMNRTPCKKCYR